MKTSLFTKTKRILSLVLCLCLVWTMVPGQIMGVYAAGVASGPMIPEFGVTTNDLWCCFANGTPITIEEGTESGTAIYYYENSSIGFRMIRIVQQIMQEILFWANYTIQEVL